MVHENDAAECLLALCGQENMTRSQVKEGKIELRAACIVSTGSGVKKGLIKDTFSPIVIDKLKTCGIETLEVVYFGDGVENVRDAVLAMRQKRPDMILCTGGMSVDPDDNTPGGIKAAGASIVAYGAPVLPGAMFLLGYFGDGMPVVGLPGCVMYAGVTIFNLLLPRIAADVPVTRADIAALVMVLSLAACGNKSDDTKDAEEPVGLTVFAAASLTESLTAIGEKYMAENKNVKLSFYFDSSGKLYLTRSHPPNA